MEGRDMGSVTNLRYHLVLTTKYRRPALQGIEQSVYDAFREVEKVSDFKIIEMNVEGGNHIHLALKCHRGTASRQWSIESRG